MTIVENESLHSECRLSRPAEVRSAAREQTKSLHTVNHHASMCCEVVQEPYMIKMSRDHFFLSETSLEEEIKETSEHSNLDHSLFSLYKSSANGGEYNSYLNEKISTGQEKKSGAKKSDIRHGSHSKEPVVDVRPKSVDFSRYASSTWKGASGQNLESAKSSKSVTFNSADGATNVDPTGLLIEAAPANQSAEGDKNKILRSISARMWQHQNRQDSNDDMDLWLAFLADAGVVERTSDLSYTPQNTAAASHTFATMDDPNLLLHQMNSYKRIDTMSDSNTQDDYEEIHRKMPGIFRDTVTMDDPDAAFHKVKNIIKTLFSEQKSLKPMFDINFHELPYYPTVQTRMKYICKQLAPHRMFY